MRKCRFFLSLLSLLGHFFSCYEDGRQMLLKHQLTLIISVFWFWSGTASMYRRYGVIAYSVPASETFQSATGLYLSAGIFYRRTPSVGLRISLSIRCFSLICCNILYPDETGNGASTWCLNPRQVYYGQTAKKCWWRRQIQLTGQRAQPSTCLYGPGGLLLLLWVMFANNRVIKPGYVDTGANWATRVNGKPEIHRLMVSRLCWLHFPTRPNLSHRTETFQIKVDSHHSVSSPQTRQLHGRTRLREQRARQAYLAALGISEAPSDLSDVLWCLLADSSTNTSADACRSRFSIETQERFCS